jgi:cell division protein ZapD
LPIGKNQSGVGSVTLYEHPLNERVRTYLRLEHLFQRFDELSVRDHPVDHHFALITLFDLVDAGSRTDLKTDILKELERHKQQFGVLRGNPSVSEEALQQLLDQLDQNFTSLNQVSGKMGQSILDNDWLGALRNRVSIPGGTCSFDLPTYHAWQQLEAPKRHADIDGWAESLRPLQNSIQLLLHLMRDTGHTQRMMAVGGQFQQTISQNKFQLLRLSLDSDLEIVPEISGNRLMVWIRMMRQETASKLQAVTDNVTFDLSLCV